MVSQTSKVSRDFVRQMEGYGLATAEILYRLPDHPALLQTFLWQDYDLCPRFPELNKFLDFWQRELEGPLHSVRVSHCGLIKPAELRAVDGGCSCSTDDHDGAGAHPFWVTGFRMGDDVVW